MVIEPTRSVSPWSEGYPHMTPEACRRKALQFDRAAEVATDPSAKCAYLDLASKWRERAEWAEALEQRLSASRPGPVVGH
jgi:hypothetical protein